MLGLGNQLECLGNQLECLANQEKCLFLLPIALAKYLSSLTVTPSPISLS